MLNILIGCKLFSRPRIENLLRRLRKVLRKICRLNLWRSVGLIDLRIQSIGLAILQSLLSRLGKYRINNGELNPTIYQEKISIWLVGSPQCKSEELF